MSQDFALPAANAAPTPGMPKTLAEHAYLRLRHDIVTGRHPPGSKLRVEHLRDEYQLHGCLSKKRYRLFLSK